MQAEGDAEGQVLSGASERPGVRPLWGRSLQEQSIAELLPARVVVETEGAALLLAMRGIQERRAMLVLPLPFGRFEIRARDPGWLELEAAGL